MMDNKKCQNILIGVIVVLAVAVIALLISRHDEDRGKLSEQSEYQSNQPERNMMGQTDTQSSSPATPAKGGNMMQAQVPADLSADQMAQLKAGAADHKPSALTFNITGGSFYFAPNEIKVKQGDKVKIIFTNAGGMHNFILEAYSVKTDTIKIGESATVEFTATKKGTFEFYCGVGGGLHRQKGQIGVLLVE